MKIDLEKIREDLDAGEHIDNGTVREMLHYIDEMEQIALPFMYPLENGK